MADVVKRLNYFDHQFLRAPDFNDEQNYHLNMRRLHNKNLHTPGIVFGLVPSAQAGATVVTVSSGFAVDSLGREMVLPADVQLDLTNEAQGKTVFFTLDYNEQQSDPSTDAGATGNTRWTESPKVSFSETAPAANSTTIVLGTVTRTATGLGAIDLSMRKNAGVVVSGDLSVNSVALKRDGVDPGAWPKLSCTGANQASFSTGSLSFDNDREIAFADNGQIRSFDGNHKIRFNRANNRLEITEFGDIIFSTGGANPPEKMRLAADGGLGVGTTASKAKLQVSGMVGNTVGLFGENQGISLVAAWPNVGFNTYFNGGWKAISPGFAGVINLDQNDGNIGFFFPPAKAAAADAALNVTRMLGILPNGKLASPMFRVTHLFDQRQGALPISATFGCAGGTLIIIFSGSGWANNTTGNIGMALQIDGANVDFARAFTNEPNSHKTFGTNVYVHPSLAAGNHTLALAVLPGTTTDFNDWFNVTIIELPF